MPKPPSISRLARIPSGLCLTVPLAAAFGLLAVAPARAQFPGAPFLPTPLAPAKPLPPPDTRLLDAVGADDLPASVSSSRPRPA